MRGTEKSRDTARAGGLGTRRGFGGQGRAGVVELSPAWAVRHDQ